MDRYEEYENAETTNRSSQREMQMYAFSSLVLVIFNYFLHGNNQHHTIVNWCVEYCGTSTPFWLAIGMLWWLVVLPVHRDDSKKNWIYCPPLYKKLEAEDEQRRIEEENWRGKLKSD